MHVTLLGWITDFFRIAWGLFFWNARKSVFRARGDHNRCPCQTRSDSGIAWKTGCEPALLYNKPARFRHVCPLLKANNEGLLKCSVNTADVRPFWGRFWVTYGSGLFLTYLLGVGIVFGAMKSIGYPIEFSTIAWPPAWKQINAVRSQFFLTKAETAYSAGDGSTAVVALSLAYSYDPENYDIGRLLAQVWSSTRPEHADQIFAELLQKHPEKRVLTARAWVQQLLSRGDYGRLERLAADALVFDHESTAAWLQSFLFANVRTQNDALIEELSQGMLDLPAGVVEVMRLEQLVRTESAAAAKAALSTITNRDEPGFVLHYRIRRLIQMGQQYRGLVLLNEWEDRFPDRDRIRLQLAAYAQGDFDNQYIELMRTLVQLSPSLAQVELICAHLVTHPNQQVYRLVKQAVRPVDIVNESERLQALNALFLLALAHGDEPTSAQIAESVQSITGTDSRALAALKVVAEQPSRYRVQSVIPLLQPISLDMIYATLEWFESISRP